MRGIKRLCIVAAAVAGTWLLPAAATSAWASSSHPKPTITSSEASFTIPSGTGEAWMIRLWTLPKPSTLEGQAVGSSGTISVAVPATKSCDFQVDVLVAPKGTTAGKDFTWYSGTTAVVAGCGEPHCPGGDGTTMVDPSGSAHVPPTLTATEASFTVPSGKAQEWVIRLWTLPTPSTLEGQQFGSSGTLSVEVPLTQTCRFQVDVKVAPLGTTDPNDFTWYSGVTGTV